MGSSSSSNVNPFEPDHERKKNTKLRSNKSGSHTRDHNDTHKNEPQRHPEKEDTVQNFKQSDDILSQTSNGKEHKNNVDFAQFVELERQNLELQDYIENLESQLEAVDREQSSKKSVDQRDIHSGKEDSLTKLRKENEDLKLEITKMKVKFKKKSKVLSVKLAEAKNEESLKLFEAKTEISTLKEENESLKEKLSGSKGSRNTNEAAAASDHAAEHSTSAHNGVILELSTRVSEQDDRIVELENILHEKNKEIERLKASQAATSPGAATPHTGSRSRGSSAASSVRGHDDDHAADDAPADWRVNGAFERRLSRQSTDTSNAAIASSRSYPGRDVRVHAQQASNVDTRNKVRSHRNDNRVKLSNGSEFVSRDASRDAQRSSVLATDAAAGAQHIVTSLRQRPGSGSTRYDADVSYCDSSPGDDASDNDVSTERDVTAASTVNRASIRQISAQRMKKRGFLRSLARNHDVDSSDTGSTGVRHKPPPAASTCQQQRRTDDDDVDQLINDLDENLSAPQHPVKPLKLLESAAVPSNSNVPVMT